MSIANKVKMSVLGGVVALGLVGCDGGGGGSVITSAWYNVYGGYCGSVLGPGCDFYADGSQITYAEDPYYADLVYGTYYYTDVYGYYSVYTGWVRASATGILYDEWGYALNSNEKHGRDVTTNAAAAQKAAINAASELLQAKYGLDAKVSGNIAVALNDWALIGKSRKRTDADVAAFTKRLTGLNVTEASAALEAINKGDMGAADQAISKAAANWSTSPDTMKQILKDWFATQKN